MTIPLPHSLDSLGSLSAAAAAVFFLIAIAYGLGRLAIGPQPAKSDVQALALIRFAVGLTFVAVVAVLIGSMASVPAEGRVWYLGTAAVVIVTAARWLVRDERIANDRSPRYRLGFARTALAVLLWLVALGPALAYPTGWDELVYHHELPRRWLVNGWLSIEPDLPYSGFPSLGEILFWVIAPIEGTIAPRLLMFCCWTTGLLSLYRLLRRRLRAEAAFVLVLGFAASSAVLLVSANCYVECLILMDVAAMLVILEDRRFMVSQPWRTTMILGVLAGGAAAVKLTGLCVVLLPVAWVLSRGLFGGAVRWRLSQVLALYLVVVVGIALPFYLRPWLQTGNPFYPYYEQWFTTDVARIETSRYHHAIGSAFGVQGWVGLFGGPLLLAILESAYDGGFGWQFLIVLGLAALSVRNKSGQTRWRVLVAPALVSCVGFYAFWVLTSQQARFAIPFVLMANILAAMGLRQVRGNARRVVLGLVLLATTFSLPWRNAGYYLGSWLVATGAITATSYVDESTDHKYVPLVGAVAELTPTNAKLLLLFEHRGFYLPRERAIGTPFFQSAMFTSVEQSSEGVAFMAELAKVRVTHVVLSQKPAGPDVLPEWLDRSEDFVATIQECIAKGHLKPVWQSETHVLLEVQQTSE